MKILKFGGTSVGTAESIAQVIGLIEKEQKENNVIVVLSAMGGVTNQLQEAANIAETGEDFAPILKEIEARHFEVIKKLLPVQAQNPVITQIRFYFNELDDILSGISTLKELSKRSLDRVLSYGELCSTFMISHIAAAKKFDVAFADARLLIKTNSDFGNAEVDFEQTNQLITAFLNANANKTIFTAGFISSDQKNNTTTLGRGGSDYTAAIFGAALKAAAIEIWTDVDGFMTADPRLVSKAFSMEDLTYTEAMELSYFGAKVIYPPTMIPAFTSQIPIIIKNTFNPCFAGTIIHQKAKPNPHPIKGLSSINKISLINIEGGGLVGHTGVSSKLFSVLAQQKINIILITQASSERSISIAVSPDEADKAIQTIKTAFKTELESKRMEAPRLEHDLSVIAIVGENMKHTPGMSGNLFHALGRNGINVVAIAQGSSEYNISVVIPQKDLAKALNAVHDAFFRSITKTLHVFMAGTGNIGKTLLRQISQHQDYLRKNNNLSIKLIGLTNSRKKFVCESGINLDDWEKPLFENGEQADIKAFTEKIASLNLSNSVFLDNTSSADVVACYPDLFKANVSVVTCNKIGNSSAQKNYDFYKQLTRKHQVEFKYETNVGAGLPIISTLHDLMVSGDGIAQIEAILSGTISYIFNNFSGDKKFFEIVKEAQEKGYTEPDPRDDLSGLDFARKMLILARDSGFSIEMDDITIAPILPPACLAAPTVEAFYQELEKADDYFENLKNKAVSAGKKISYIGTLKDGKVIISLLEIEPSHAFYSLSGSDNIIAFTTDRYTERPLVVKGPGAGAEVTAAGVFADLMKIGSKL